MEIKKNGFVVIQAFMINELNLKGNELMIYAIIYGLSQAENQYFTGSLEYLSSWTGGTSKTTVMKSLNSLIDKGLLIKKEVKKGVIKNCLYKAVTTISPIAETVTESNDTITETDIDHSRNCYGTITETDINNIDNIEDNIDKRCAGVPAPQPPQQTEETKKQEEEKRNLEAEEFAKNIKELRDIAINSTGQDKFFVESLIAPYKYKGVIKELLAKIKASDFLMGKKKQKPKLIVFTRQDKITEILTGAYDNFDKEDVIEKKENNYSGFNFDV